MTATNKLALELLAAAAANQTLANATFAQLNQLVMAGVVDKDLATPPGSPANEALYIVAASATGDWATKDGQLAYWLDSTAAWQFIVPREGFLVHVNDEDRYYKYEGAAWGLFTAASPVVTESTTARVLALTDNGAYIRHTNAGASTVTFPPQSSVAWGALTETHHRCAGAGGLTLTQGSGVTLNPPAGGTLVLSDGMTVTVKRVASDVWDVIGQTVPA